MSRACSVDMGSDHAVAAPAGDGARAMATESCAGPVFVEPLGTWDEPRVSIKGGMMPADDAMNEAETPEVVMASEDEELWDQLPMAYLAQTLQCRLGNP